MWKWNPRYRNPRYPKMSLLLIQFKNSILPTNFLGSPNPNNNNTTVYHGHNNSNYSNKHKHNTSKSFVLFFFLLECNCIVFDCNHISRYRQKQICGVCTFSITKKGHLWWFFNALPPHSIATPTKMTLYLTAAAAKDPLPGRMFLSCISCRSVGYPFAACSRSENISYQPILVPLATASLLYHS
jgi:hypothetical protein